MRGEGEREREERRDGWMDEGGREGRREIGREKEGGRGRWMDEANRG